MEYLFCMVLLKVIDVILLEQDSDAEDEGDGEQAKSKGRKRST